MRTRSGFSLVEMIVVVMIVGILASFALPYYVKSRETSLALNAKSLVQAIGNANRMAYVNTNNTYYSGRLYSIGTGSGFCSSACGSATGCDLMACKYLAQVDWNTDSYLYYACSGAAAGCCAAASAQVACARRKNCSNPGDGTPCSSNASYTPWGYDMNTDGSIVPVAGSP